MKGGPETAPQHLAGEKGGGRKGAVNPFSG